MNILIKLTCLIGLVIAPILGGHTEGDIPNQEETVMTSEAESRMISKEVKMEKNTENDFVTAYVTVTKSVNGEEVTESFEFEGSELEVRKQVDAIN